MKEGKLRTEDLIVLTFCNILNFSKFKCKCTFGICKNHRLSLRFLQMLSEAHIALQAAHKACSGFLFIAKGDEGFHTANILLVQGLWTE